MSPDERRQLARLLASIDEPHVLRDNRSRWRRRVALLLSMGSCVVLAAWIAVLMLTLPKHYTAGHWRGAWVGFDLALLGAFAATAWAAWRERQVLIILLTVTGTLLCCDAWFDVVMQLEGITADIPPLWKIPLFAEGLAAALPARYRTESRDVQPQEPAAV